MPTKKQSEIVDVYLLLDRSGSMANRWDEALSSLNTYVIELAKKQPKALVTLATFDEHGGFMFDILRNKVQASKWEDVTNRNACPRGMTPLYDAIGRIVSIANTSAHEKAVFVIMTDGMENASKEVQRATAKGLLDGCERKGWQVVFLGADFNAYKEASAVGVGLEKTLNMKSGNYTSAMRSMAEKTVLYASCSTTMSFTSEDKEKASK